MVETITIIGLVVASLGCLFALLNLILSYVRRGAERKLETKVDSLQLQVPMGSDDSRIGIVPQKHVMVQKNQIRESSHNVEPQSSHFVSYFGVCFEQQQAKMIDLNDPNAKVLCKARNGNEAPLNSIEVMQHGSGRLQTPPTDDDTDPSSRHSMSTTSNDDNDDQDAGISTASESKSNDEDDDISFNKSGTFEAKHFVFHGYDGEHDDVHVEKNETNEFDEDDDDDASFVTPEQYPIHSEDSKNAANYEEAKNNPLTSKDDGIPLSLNINHIVESIHEATHACDDAKLGSESIERLENPAYFSSDDEKSSSGEQVEDDTSFGSYENGYSSRTLLVGNIHSSLSLPDLQPSGSSCESGKWELSASSGSGETPEMVNDTKMDSNDNLNSSSFGTEICIFCDEEYNKKEGVRFSYDEKCTHLMCMNCINDGKFSKCNGECPQCNAGKNSLRKPPRANQKIQPIQEMMSM